MLRIAAAFNLILALSVTSMVGDAVAQSERASEAFYFRAGTGFADYVGDFNTEPPDFDEFRDGDGFPWELSGEAGYQFSPLFNVGVGYRLGNYPLIEGDLPGSDALRHSIMTLARYHVRGDRWRVAPYVDFGGNLTFGGEKTGYGPSFGLGGDVTMSRKVSLYVESRMHWTFDDEASDGFKRNEGFDMVNTLLGVGVKYTFKSTTSPPPHLAVEGPLMLEAGSTGTFTATIDAEATPVAVYTWDFGDGTMAEGIAVSHTYRQPGTYPVTLVAHSGAHRVQRSLTVTVTRAPARPGSFR